MEQDNKNTPLSIITFASLVLPLIAFSPYNFFVFEVPKITIISIISSLFILITILSIFKKDSIRKTTVDISKIILVILITIIFQYFILGKNINIKFIGLTFPVLFLFFCYVNLPREAENNAFKYISLIVSAIALYGILQRIGIDFPIWSGNVGKKTVFSTIGNPNTAAEIAFFTVPVMIFIAGNQKTKKSLLFQSAAIILSLVFGFFCLSKGAALSFFLSCLVFLFLYKKHINKLKPFLNLLIFCGILIIFISTFIIIQKNNNGSIKSIISPNSPGIKNRISIYLQTLEVIKENPILGVSGGGFHYEYTKLFLKNDRILKDFLDPQAILVRRAHNEFLHVASEFGIVGLAGLIMFWGILFFILNSLIKKDKNFIYIFWSFSFLFFESFFNFPLQNPALLVLIVFLLSIVIKNTNQKQESNSIYLKILYSSILLISLVIAFFNIRIFISDIYHQKSKNLIISGDLPAAKKYLEKASALDHQNGTVWGNLGIVELNLNNKKEADIYLKTAEKYLVDYNIYLNLAFLKRSEKNLKASTDYFRKAISINPYDNQIKFEYLQNLYYSENYEKALSEFYAINFDRIVPRDHLLAGLIMKVNGDYAKAENYFQIILDQNDPEMIVQVLKNYHRKEFLVRKIKEKNNLTSFEYLLLSGIEYYSGNSEEAEKILEYLINKETDPLRKKYLTGIKYEISGEFSEAEKIYESIDRKITQIDLARIYFKQGKIQDFLKSMEKKTSVYSLPFYHEDINVFMLYKFLYSSQNEEKLFDFYKICQFTSSESPLLLYFKITYNFNNDQAEEALKELSKIKNYLYYFTNTSTTFLPLFLVLFKEYNYNDISMVENPVLHEQYLLKKYLHYEPISDNELVNVFNLYFKSRTFSFKEKIDSKEELERNFPNIIKKYKQKITPTDYGFFLMLIGKYNEADKIFSKIPNENSKRNEFYRLINLWGIEENENKSALLPDYILSFAQDWKTSPNLYVLFMHYISTDYQLKINKNNTFSEKLKIHENK